jgi:ATP-binding cassette subfamily C protein
VSILDFLWSPLFLGAVFILSPLVGWVVVAGLALLGLIITVKLAFAKARDERFSEASEKIDDLKDKLLVSRDVIESQQMMAAYNERWVQARRRARDGAVELKDWNAWFTILSSHTALLIQYVALATAAFLAISGELTIGAMVACMYLSRQVFFPMERFLQQIPSIGEAFANWKTLDRTLKTARSSVGIAVDGAPLRLSHVTVRSMVTNRRLLRNISFEILPGSAVEIVGSTSSGKTLLAEALIGRCPRTTLMAGQAGLRRSGDILLGTTEIEQLSIVDAAKTIGYVPQLVAFVTGTIEENIAGLEIEPDANRVMQVARLAQIHDRILALRDGYSTRIDAAGSIFSKSERHQLALARALYSDPRILVVDEPDQSFREALSRSLKSEVADFLGRGGILVILTRVALRSYKLSRRFNLDDGELKEVELTRAMDRKIVRIQDDGEAQDAGPTGRDHVRAS